MKLGISGALTRASISSPLTPLFLVAAVLVGTLALLSLPREEEPQISVPMVDIQVTANGYKASDAIELITKPLEDIVKAINGVEHVYSFTQDDAVLVTARFLVGTSEDTALLRIHEKIRANIVDLPKGILPEPDLLMQTSVRGESRQIDTPFLGVVVVTIQAVLDQQRPDPLAEDILFRPTLRRTQEQEDRDQEGDRLVQYPGVHLNAAFRDRNLPGGIHHLIPSSLKTSDLSRDQLMRMGMMTYRNGSMLFTTPGDSSSISSKNTSSTSRAFNGSIRYPGLKAIAMSLPL